MGCTGTGGSINSARRSRIAEENKSDSGGEDSEIDTGEEEEERETDSEGTGFVGQRTKIRRE